jgi:hypothetical protein
MQEFCGVEPAFDLANLRRIIWIKRGEGGWREDGRSYIRQSECVGFVGVSPPELIEHFFVFNLLCLCF